VSRYFDLMQEMERDKPSRAGIVIEPAYPFSDQNRARHDRRQMTSDLTLGLVQQMFLQPIKDTPRMVVFAGIDHGSGCSQIAASVAETLGLNAPGRVCLVEANFRSPGLPSALGTTNGRGLTDALLEEGSIWRFLKPVWNERIWFLSSGPVEADSPNLLSSERLNARFAELRKEFEFVIVDAPPLTQCADAIRQGQLSDGVVLVLEANSTRREAALAVTESLRSSGVKIIGAVLNKRTFPIPEKIYRRL
jgi:Mrp family chromosome partitioning ATPase